MNAVMGFVKAHLISLLCGVGCLVALVVAALGMSSDAVAKAMEARKREIKADQIAGLKSSAKNQEVINVEIERGRRFQEEYDRTVKAAYEINERRPLMDGVFPVAERLNTPYEFVEAYEVAMRRLPTELVAGTLPDAADVQEEVEAVRDLQEREAEREREESLQPDLAAGAATPGGRKPPAPGTRTPLAPTAAPRTGPGGARAPGAADATLPKYNPLLRARVNKARTIRTYINPGTFHTSPILDKSRPGRPGDIDLWKAQVSLWIQQDVVDAIARMNREAAEQHKDVEVCVEHVPVKHVVAIDVQGYQVSPTRIERFESLSLAGSSGAGGRTFDPGGPVESFTARAGDEAFDVVRFRVQVVVDQRDLLRLIDHVTRTNFYLCVGIEYEPVPPEHERDGYLYGAAPCVLATTEWEGYMARAIYDKWMPRGMRNLLGGSKDSEIP